MAYVDVEKLKRNIRINFMPNVDVDGTVTVENAERYFLNLIEKTSTADVVEVVHGEWIKTENPLGWQDADCLQCSVCHEDWIMEEEWDFEVYAEIWKYCPNCGAKMDGGEK